MLEVHNISVSYEQHRALEDISIRVEPGEIVVILGANGAGKSTLLRAISGICEGRLTGSIEMDGQPILGLTSDSIVERGIALVPEGRGIFADLTVRENLTLGAYSKRARKDEIANLQRVMRLFPKLSERQGQIVRTMSGGEQQMVAIGRAMMSNPSILLLDEPSLGLSPLLCKQLFRNLKQVCEAGIGILLVEQNAKQSLAIADRGYLLENAHIVHQESAAILARDPAVQEAYLGTGRGKSTTQETMSAKQSSAPITSTPIPIMARVNSHPAIRRSADELIGTPINELVDRAAKTTRQSLAPAGTRHVVSVSLSKNGHADRLRAMKLEIERAACDARRKPRSLSNENAEVNENAQIPQKPARSSAQNSNEPPVVIEVYRAPRVDVWRRQSGSDEFIKD